MLYESYIHPVTILSTLPSAGIGALLALMLAGSDLDVIGIIGIVLLIGIVKKNGIMIVDFALEAERKHGKSPEEAIFQASILRFRPILMTTLAAMLGALPLLLGTGTGSELRRPLGLAIIGGLLVSQVLTLFTTPVIYLLFDRLSQRFGRKASRALRRGRPCEHPGALHQPARRDVAARDRHRAVRPARLFPSAGRAAAERHHAGRRGAGEHGGRQPGHHGLDRGRAARAASRHHRRGHRAHLDQLSSAPRMVVVQFAINRDINGAARDVEAAIQAARADLPTTLRGNPSYREYNPADSPDHHPGADLEHPDHGAALRLGRHGDPAAAVADHRRRADPARRQRAAFGARRAPAGQAVELRHRHSRTCAPRSPRPMPTAPRATSTRATSATR